MTCVIPMAGIVEVILLVRVSRLVRLFLLVRVVRIARVDRPGIAVSPGMVRLVRRLVREPEGDSMPGITRARSTPRSSGTTFPRRATTASERSTGARAREQPTGAGGSRPTR